MDDAVKEELETDTIANVAAIIGMLQGEITAAHFPQDALADLEKIGIFGPDYIENLKNMVDYTNKELGTAASLSVLSSLLGCKILVFDSDRFNDIFDIKEGSYLQ